MMADMGVSLRSPEVIARGGFVAVGEIGQDELEIRRGGSRGSRVRHEHASFQGLIRTYGDDGAALRVDLIANDVDLGVSQTLDREGIAALVEMLVGDPDR